MSKQIPLPTASGVGLSDLGKLYIYSDAIEDVINGINAVAHGDWNEGMKSGANGLANVAAPVMYSIMKDQYDQIQSGERDTAGNIQAEIEFARAKEKYDREIKAAKGDPNRIMLAKYNFDKRIKSFIGDYDPNTKFQQLRREEKALEQKEVAKNQQQEQPAKTTEENKKENVVQAPTGLAKIVQQEPVSNNPKRIRYSDIDLNSEQSRQIINSADMKRSIQDYINRSDLSDDEKQQRAVADVIAYNLKNNRMV